MCNKWRNFDLYSLLDTPLRQLRMTLQICAHFNLSSPHYRSRISIENCQQLIGPSWYCKNWEIRQNVDIFEILIFVSLNLPNTSPYLNFVEKNINIYKAMPMFVFLIFCRVRTSFTTSWFLKEDWRISISIMHALLMLYLEVKNFDFMVWLQIIL